MGDLVLGDARLDIVSLGAADAAARLGELAGLLHACVHAGASIGFVLPFEMASARAYWERKVFPALGHSGLVLLTASIGGRLAGTAQLDHDTPANQPHRAEVRKVLVHPDFRRRGIARALMARIEEHAGTLGRTLLTLDTRTGDAAEPLYASLGYATTGTIPGYCLDPFDPAKRDATTIMYKALSR